MSGGKGGSEGEPMIALGFLLLLAFLFGWFLWHQFKAPILEVFRWIRYGEMWIVYAVTGGERGACLDWLRHVQYGINNPPPQIMTWANECFGASYLQTLPSEGVLDHYRLSPASMKDIQRVVTYYDRWPFAAIFVAIGIYYASFTKRNLFKTRLNLEGFINVQSKMWPIIAPIVKFNPSKFSARKPGDMVPDVIPPYAEALSPEEWIAWHRIPVTNNIPDREATRRAFLLQLGPRWTGIHTAPIYIRALYAVFALKGAQKREEADAMLGDIALCWSLKGGLRLTGKLQDRIHNILNDPNVGGRADAIADQHAFRTTAVLSVLKWCRTQGGVLAPAQFTWVRAVDRNLWYPLNNLGRRSFHTEGAGALAHFMAEQIAKKPLPVPRIDTAIITLNGYMTRDDALPIPPREGDKSR
jgi:hypothetical protein